MVDSVKVESDGFDTEDHILSDDIQEIKGNRTSV